MKKIPKAEAILLLMMMQMGNQKKIKNNRNNPKAVRKIYTKMFLIFRRN